MNGMFGQMMQPSAVAALPARLDRQEKMLEACFYVVLTDDQKKVADGLAIGPMGMM
jgi:hypothetical protein